MTLYQILAIIAVVTFIVFTVFNIIYLMDLRKTSRALRQFIAHTEQNLNPVLSELRHTLQDVRKITGDVSEMVERIRSAVNAVVAVERSIEGLYGYYREAIGQTANVNLAALKAGVKAGVVNLVKNLRSRHEKEESL